ncbi:glycosyl hydrolase family 14-domain-containing protein [Gorgonomyces haynaldii]|nr:glycosyl hydrolase family 14-domain-containing protein [Gorgonomyces haynaldii]
MLSFISLASVSAFNPSYRAEALGPLSQITDWNAFSADLRRIKSLGVVAFATDVWWGLVEKQDQVFDWSYYDKLSDAIIKEGLQWIPILSTHQCGAPNDPACYYPVPSWTGITSNPNNGFQDIFGNVNYESFSPWSGDYVYQQYDELFAAFAEHYLPKKASIARIDLSGGTSGELRYPSYSINWSYPARGQIQAYSPAAVADFRNYIVNKYSLTFKASLWGAQLNTLQDITPPCDTTVQAVSGVCAGKTGGDNFFKANSAYAVDFGEWYQSVLIRHGKRISDSAHARLDIFGVKIAMKIAGVHWQFYNPTEPRSAEKAAGYWNYTTILSALRDQNLEATFTAIELNDNGAAPFYSGANTLTNQVLALCQQLGTSCGTENALNIGFADVSGYGNMRNVLTRYNAASLTFLRYQDLTKIGSGQFFASYVASVGNERFVWFAVDNIPTSFGQNLVIVGSDPKLGAWNVANALPLTTYSCTGSTCLWTGYFKTTATSVSFQVYVTGANRRQCSTTTINLNKVNNVWINTQLTQPQSADIQVTSVAASLC